jgi:hypothetical protein
LAVSVGSGQKRAWFSTGMGKNGCCVIWSVETAKLERKIKGHVGIKKESSELQDSASDVGQVREGVLALWSQWMMKLRRLL